MDSRLRLLNHSILTHVACGDSGLRCNQGVQWCVFWSYCSFWLLMLDSAFSITPPSNGKSQPIFVYGWSEAIALLRAEEKSFSWMQSQAQSSWAVQSSTAASTKRIKGCGYCCDVSLNVKMQWKSLLFIGLILGLSVANSIGPSFLEIAASTSGPSSH